MIRILTLAREIELAWPGGDRHLQHDFAQNRKFQELKREIAALDDARLAAIAKHLHDLISLAHFYACTVPLERAAARTPRDDEFLVTEVDDLLRDVQRVPVKLIVENLRSAFNVGAIFRTAECLGVSEILLCGYTPGPDDEKTLRTAMGTSGLVPWRRVDRAVVACQELHAEGYTLVALETAASATSLNEFKFGNKVAFVLGNERFGIEAGTLSLADQICRIPMRGVKNSMNVSVAFGIAAFEWLRQHDA